MPDGSTAGPGRNKVCGSLCRVGAHGWRSRSRSDGCLSSSDRGLDTRQPRVSLRRNGRPHSDLQAVVSKRRHGSASFTATHQYPHLRLRRAMESIGSRFDSVGFDPRFSQERDQPRPIEDRHVRDLYRSVRVASSRRLPSIEPTHHGLAEVHRQSLPSPDKACMPQLPMRQIDAPMCQGSGFRRCWQASDGPLGLRGRALMRPCVVGVVGERAGISM